MGDKENFEFDRNEDTMDYSTSMPSDRRFGGANLASTHVGLVPMGNSINASRGELIGSSSCSSASLVESYGPRFWDHHPTNSQNLGLSDINGQNNGSSINTIGIRKEAFVFPRAGIDRTLEMGCSPTYGMLKGDVFLPNGPGNFPHSLSQFPTDSGFIECATRFSCFSGGNFGDIVSSYGVPQSMGVYGRSGGTMHRARDAFSGLGLESASGGQSQETDLNVSDAVKNATEGSSLKNEKRSESRVSLHDEAKSDGAECSGQDDSQMLERTSGEPSIRGMNSNKRKRSIQDSDNFKAKVASELPGEAAKDNSECLLKDQQPPSTNKTSGKNAKQGSQASDQAKEECIHVRARSGQATNSHSLAERIRREKISERMKYLQDLVPGCSKVTGKAVMLDEIINYVQSLQRQVEFLSMKLATVNPQLDFNLQGLTTKDILQQRPGPPSALEYTPKMPMDFPPLHPSPLGLIQSNLSGMANTYDILTRTIRSQITPLSGGFMEPNQLPDVWEDELHNAAQIGFAATAPPSSQDQDASVPASQMKS